MAFAQRHFRTRTMTWTLTARQKLVATSGLAVEMLPALRRGRLVKIYTLLSGLGARCSKRQPWRFAHCRGRVDGLEEGRVMQKAICKREGVRVSDVVVTLQQYGGTILLRKSRRLAFVDVDP
mmetsp:Transcript_59724/g.133046  ORF Transcript_59724/g.133046 Transcript_59724/m.133046 type:complete len:122 (+) Transcript_59724:1194-1559(+)